MLNDLADKMPKFYGAVTVGERGQIAIPAEARRELEIEAGTKLVVLGGHEKRILIMLKAEAVTEILTHTTALLSQFEQVLKTDNTESSKDKR